MSLQNQNTYNTGVIFALKIICIVMVTGVGFGILMSIVSNAFVTGVEFLFNSRDKLSFLNFELNNKTVG